MNNVIMQKITVGPEYQPLAALDLIASVTISCLPSNASPVYFRADGGDGVPWLPGEWHEFRRINLATIEAKGAPGDAVTVIGGTW